MRHLAANEIEPEEQGSEALPRPDVPTAVAAGPAQVLALQRAAGNQAVARMLVARRPRRPPLIAPGTPPANGGPTPADPSSGIDWEAFFKGNEPSRIRTVLELGRVIPGLGFLAGGLSDTMNAAQDLFSVHSVAPPELQAFMAGRHTIAMVNAGLGHTIYCMELVQDIATGSVVGAELDALTGPLNAMLISGKITIDGFQAALDVGLLVLAKYGATHPLPGSGDEAQKAWDEMVHNYEANVLGDIAGGVLDVIDLATVGFANVQPIKQGVRVMKELWDQTGSARALVFTTLQGWFNIWGGKLMEHAGGAEGIARAVAGGQIALELQRIKACYQLGDLLIGEAAEYVAGEIAELERGAELVLGGRDPFVTARDSAVAGLEALEAHLADLGEMRALSTTAGEKAVEVDAACAEALALLDTVAVPEIDVPAADVGEGAAAELAEGALNFAGDLAEAGIGALVGRLEAQLELVKDTLRAPLETIQENSAAFGEFMQLVSEEAAVQLVVAEERTVRVREQLATCESYEDVVDTIIDQIFEVVGLHADFEVDDLRQLWAELGMTIDDAIVWAEALRDGREVPPPVIDAGEEAPPSDRTPPHEDHDGDQHQRGG